MVVGIMSNTVNPTSISERDTMATTFTREEVATVLSQAADTIIDRAELPDQGAVDALNLLVNAALSALDNGGEPVDLETVVEDNYSADSLEEVLGWCRR